MRIDRYNSRFHQLGFSAKAIIACLVIVSVWLYLPLGIVTFGCFLYLHLLLQDVRRAPIDDAAILAPLDGKIVTIANDGRETQITLIAEALGSQIICAPVDGVLHDKLWMDGLYLPLEMNEKAADAARFEVQIHDDNNQTIRMTLYASQFTRLLHVPFEEGQYMKRAEPFGYALLRAHLTIHFPADLEVKVKEGQYCIAGQTAIAAS